MSGGQGLAASVGSCFLLPVISDVYLQQHFFEDWKAIWRKQCADNKELKFSEMQLKQVVLQHIAMPWKDKIIELAMSETLEAVLGAIAERCRIYQPRISTNM